MSIVSKIFNRINLFYIKLYYYWYYKDFANKLKKIMKFNESDISLQMSDQEEQALPGFTKYKKTGWHKYMFGRYFYALKFIKDKVVLDSGCGLGWGSYLIGNWAKKIVSIDLNQNALDFARRTWQENKIDFLNCSILEIDSLKTKFDVILSYEIIEHLKYEDGVKYLEQIGKNLGSKGKLVMSSYFPTNEHDALKETNKNPYHLHIYTKQEITKLLLSNKFTNIKFIGNLMLVATK